MDNFLRMLECASLLLMCVVLIVIARDLQRCSMLMRNVFIGVTLSIVGILVMHNPVEPMAGIRVDPRGAVLALAGAFGGPVAAAISALVLGGMRTLAGGKGAMVGVLYIGVTALASSLIWYYWHRWNPRRLDWRYVFQQALAAGIAPTLVILSLSAAPPAIYWLSVSFILPVNLLSVWLFGWLVLKDTERRKAIAARHAAEEKTRKVASSAAVILFEITQQGDSAFRFTFLTGATRQLLGVEEGHLMAQPQVLDGMLADPDRRRLAEKLLLARKSEKPQAFDLEAVRPDGAFVYLRVIAEFKGAHDADENWEGVIVDVTEERRTSQMKDNFISIVSHELRTPLTAIQSSLGMLNGGAGGTLPETAKRMVHLAKQNGDRLMRLVNEILDTEQLQAGKMNFHFVRQSGRAAVEAVIQSLHSYMPERGVQILLLDDSDAAMVEVDPVRLEQVISNLLSNAIKFSPQGGLVTLHVAVRSERVHISVSDQGSGIPEEFAQRVFRAFEQAEAPDTRKQGGSGLGLSIARSLTLEMNGEISFETAPTGTTFDISFPLAARDTGMRVVPSDDIVLGGADQLSVFRLSRLLAERGVLTHALNRTHPLPEVLTARAPAVLLQASEQSGNPPLLANGPGDAGTHFAAIVQLGDIPEDLLQMPVILWAKRPDVLEDVLYLLPGLSTVRPARLLYAGGDGAMVELLKAQMPGQATLTACESVSEVLDHLEETVFDTIVLDLALPWAEIRAAIGMMPSDQSLVILGEGRADTAQCQAISRTLSALGDGGAVRFPLAKAG